MVSAVLDGRALDAEEWPVLATRQVFIAADVVQPSLPAVDGESPILVSRGAAPGPHTRRAAQTIGFGGNGLVGGVPGGPGDGCGGRGTGGTVSGPVGDAGGCGVDVLMGSCRSKVGTVPGWRRVAAR